MGMEINVTTLYSRLKDDFKFKVANPNLEFSNNSTIVLGESAELMVA